MRYRIRLTTATGEVLHWRKGGGIHTLDERLGPLWVQNFKPALFQIAADGQLVPRGTAGAQDIAGWELEPEVSA